MGDGADHSIVGPTASDVSQYFTFVRSGDQGTQELDWDKGPEQVRKALGDALGARNVAFLLGAGCSSMMRDGTERGIATMAPLAAEFCGAAGAAAGGPAWALDASDLSCLAGHGLALDGDYTRNLERLMNPAADDALVGRPFLHDRLVVVAAPDLSPLTGGVFPAVVRGRDVESSWMIDTTDGQRAMAIDPVLRLSSLVMIRDAARLGAGVARLPLSLVSRDIARGRLIAWGDVPTSRVALWALYPSRRLLNARVSAFLVYLRQSFPNGTAEELAAYLDDRC